RHRGCGEVDVLDVVFENAVGRDYEQVAWADRHLMGGQRVGYAVAHDAACQQGRGPDLRTPGAFGDKVGGHVADADPAQRAGLEVDAGQRDCRPSCIGQAAVAQLQLDIEWLSATTVHNLFCAQRRGLGRSAVAESVRYAEQRGRAVDVDRDRKVAAHLFAR